MAWVGGSQFRLGSTNYRLAGPWSHDGRSLCPRHTCRFCVRIAFCDSCAKLRILFFEFLSHAQYSTNKTVMITITIMILRRPIAGRACWVCWTFLHSNSWWPHIHSYSNQLRSHMIPHPPSSDLSSDPTWARTQLRSNPQQFTHIRLFNDRTQTDYLILVQMWFGSFSSDSNE